MITFLRWLGMFNAAIWLGGTLFFTFVAAPAFFSKEMETLLTKPYAGAAAQVVLGRYFFLHYVCAAIAFFHVTAEWLYTGKSARGKLLFTLIVIAGLGLMGGLWFQPTLKGLHVMKYRGATKEVRDKAESSFKVLHGVAQGSNLIMALGILFYFQQAVSASNSSRFIPTQKFRG